MAGNPSGSDLVQEAPRTKLASISKVDGSGREIRVGERVIPNKEQLDAVAFTSGNIHDSKMVGQVTKNQKGSFFCDAGYLKNSKELVELANFGRCIYAATRQNMNRLMTGEQWEYLRKRNIIESDWGILKQNYFLEYH